MKKVIIFLFVFLISFNIFSQSAKSEVISSGGEFYENSNNSLSWTIGEVVVETTKSANNILTQGFQQPSYSLSTIKENINSEFEILAYPNPTSDFLNLEIKTDNKSYDIELEIIDISGKVVLNQKIKESISKINLSNFSKGTYLLKVFSKEIGEINVYKIQKIR